MRAFIMSAACIAALLLLGNVRGVPVGAEKPREVARTRPAAVANLGLRLDWVGFEPNTPLKEALAFVSEQCGVTILVDLQAFKDELQVDEAENQPVKLARMPRTSAGTVLNLLLGQVQGDYFVSREGTVWIVPRESLTRRLLAQQVSASFARRPLHEALKELTDLSGVSIVLDERRAGDKAKTPVTADLRNVSLAAAVALLADLAELHALPVDRALYVTTSENAQQIRTQQKRDQVEVEKRPADAAP